MQVGLHLGGFLLLRPFLFAEKRVDDDNSSRAKSPHGFLQRTKRNVMGDVPVGTLAGEKDSREVDFLQPRISFILCLIGQPLNGDEGVVVRHGKPVLRRQLVLYRKDDLVARRGAEAAEEGVVAGPGRAAETEASPVEVNDQGKLGL